VRDNSDHKCQRGTHNLSEQSQGRCAGTLKNTAPLIAIVVNIFAFVESGKESDNALRGTHGTVSF
jgi:hypothetical protein